MSQQRQAKYSEGAQHPYEEWVSSDGAHFLTVNLVEPESHQKFRPYFLAAEHSMGMTLQVAQGDTVLAALEALAIEGWTAPTDAELEQLTA